MSEFRLWYEEEVYKKALESLKLAQLAMGEMVLHLEEAEKAFIETLPEIIMPATIDEAKKYTKRIYEDSHKLGHKIELIPNVDGFLIKFTAPRLAFIEEA